MERDDSLGEISYVFNSVQVLNLTVGTEPSNYRPASMNSMQNPLKHHPRQDYITFNFPFPTWICPQQRMSH